MEVVVVMDEHLHDAGGSVKAGAGTDEDELRARLHESVDQVLCEPVVDLVDRSRRPFAPVAARVVDIGVEPVLVRDVAGPAEARPEVAAMRARQVADPDPRGVRVGGGVGVDHGEKRAYEPVGAEPPPRPVRGAPQHGIPREEVDSLPRQPHAADEAPGVWQPDRERPVPDDARLEPPADSEPARRTGRPSCPMPATPNHHRPWSRPGHARRSRPGASLEPGCRRERDGDGHETHSSSHAEATRRVAAGVPASPLAAEPQTARTAVPGTATPRFAS